MTSDNSIASAPIVWFPKVSQPFSLSAPIYGPVLSSSIPVAVAIQIDRVSCDLLYGKHRSECYFFAAAAGGGGGPAVVVTETGSDPAGKGGPGTGVSAPVVPSMVYAETLLEN
jgi:hypothetical protein